MQKYIVLIVGVLFLGIGGFLFYRNNSLIKNCTEKAEATVVDMKQEFADPDSTNTYMYSPIIEYKVGEDTIRVTMDKSSSTPAYEINEKISIKYNPKKVKEFIVEGDNSSNIFSIVFMALGVLVTGYGIVTLFKKD